MSDGKNHLLELLPARARARVLSSCESVELTLAQVLWEPGTATHHIYFPTRGFVSLVAVVDDRSGLEVGLVGNEGMLGGHVALASSISPLRSLVRGPGIAWRMSVARFRTELSEDRMLQRGVHRYLAVRMSQMATSVACARYHLIGPRLARWLLMSQDRAHADRFHVTQELLSSMLGVRRVGVTVAAGGLHALGLIEYHRGDVVVVDRKGLEAAACSCYAKDRASYATLAHRH